MADYQTYMVMVADLSLKDDASTLRDGESFLKNYPASDMYEAVKAEMNGAISASRMTAAPAPNAQGPDPCPDR